MSDLANRQLEAVIFYYQFEIFSLFKKSDKNFDGKLSLKEVKDFFSTHDFEVNDNELREAFKRLDSDHDNSLNEYGTAYYIFQKFYTKNHV